MPRLIWIAIVAFGGILLLSVSFAAWRCHQLAPHVHQSARSPDGTWSTEIIKQRRSLVFEGVTVTVRVRDADGDVLFERAIDERDLWDDVERRYPVLEMTDDELRVGPRWWNGESSTYFTMSKAEALAGRSDALERRSALP